MEILKQKEADFVQKNELEIKTMKIQKERIAEMESSYKQKTLEVDSLKKTINENY